MAEEQEQERQGGEERAQDEVRDHYPEFMHTVEEDELARRRVTFFELVFRVGFLVVTWAFVVRFVPRALVVAWLSIWAYRLVRDLLVGVARKSSCLSLMVAGIGWLMWGAMLLLWLD